MTEKRGITERMVGALDGWKRLTSAMERTLVDNIAATAPWLAPLAPAYLAYRAMLDVLMFPQWVALAMGITVELLGISTINTTLTFWTWNRRKNKSEAAAPTSMAGVVAVFYLMVVLVVNVMLDDASPTERAAKALLSSLSAAAAVTLALRSQHGQRLDELKSLRMERREDRLQGKLLKVKAEDSEKQAENLRNMQPVAKDSGPVRKFLRWPDVPFEERLKIARMNVHQVMESYGVIERTAYNWMQNALKDAGVIGELARFQQEQEDQHHNPEELLPQSTPSVTKGNQGEPAQDEEQEPGEQHER